MRFFRLSPLHAAWGLRSRGAIEKNDVDAARLKSFLTIKAQLVFIPFNRNTID